MSAPQALTVLYTVSGSANVWDYAPELPGTITIPAGSSNARLRVTAIQDYYAEWYETLTLTLSPGGAYAVGNPNSAEVWILDNNNFGWSWYGQAVDDTASTDEDVPAPIDVMANDWLSGRERFYVRVTSQPAHGRAVVDYYWNLRDSVWYRWEEAWGKFIYYEPNPDFHGQDSFTYEVWDFQYGSPTTTATVTVAVNSVNDRPVAGADSFRLDEGQTLRVSGPELLANDRDADGDRPRALKVSDPGHGSLTFFPDGAFTYAPAPGFTGTDSFTYRVTDGTLESDPATVSLVVEARNDAPVAVGDYFEVDQGGILSHGGLTGLLVNDRDPDGDPLRARLVTGPRNGWAAVFDDGSFLYEPAPDFSGLDAFTYVAADGTLQSEPVTVAVAVARLNNPPVAQDEAVDTAVDVAVTVALLANDSDPDGDPLTLDYLSDPARGTLVRNANGTVTYTPEAGFRGVERLAYTLRDGRGGTGSATLTIGVGNQPPAAAADAYGVTGSWLFVEAPGVLTNDADPNGDGLRAVLVGEPGHGTLHLFADGSLSYVPAPNHLGPHTFTYKVTDGRLESAPATVTLDVLRGNTAPAAAGEAFTLDEDFESFQPAPGLLANDTDAEGDPLSVEVVAYPQYGYLAWDPNGSFRYLPAEDFFGVDAFTYRVSDGALASAAVTATLTVREKSDDLAAVDDAAATIEAVPLEIDVFVNDQGVTGSTYVVTVGDAREGTAWITEGGAGLVSYSPRPDFVGLDAFTYTLADGRGTRKTATVTVSVTAVNDDPVAGTDWAFTRRGVAKAIWVVDNDRDPDRDELTVSQAAAGAHGTVTAAAGGKTVTYTPDAGYTGWDTFTYSVEDGRGGEAEGTVRVFVAPDNLPEVRVTATDAEATEPAYEEDEEGGEGEEGEEEEGEGEEGEEEDDRDYGEFTFHRTGNLTQPLVVHARLSGSAIHNELDGELSGGSPDYTPELSTLFNLEFTVEFPAGQATVKHAIYPV